MYSSLGFAWVLGAFLHSLVIQERNWSQTWENWENATATFEHLVTIAAIITGGVWAYLRFIRERLNQPRLELRVSGQVLEWGGINYLIITAWLKNIGTAFVDIDKIETGIDIHLYKASGETEEIEWTYWDKGPFFRIFKEHGWTEPGETIVDQILLTLPNVSPPAVIKLNLIIFSRKFKKEWQSVAIINASDANKLVKSATLKGDGDGSQLEETERT